MLMHFRKEKNDISFSHLISNCIPKKILRMQFLGIHTASLSKNKYTQKKNIAKNWSKVAHWQIPHRTSHASLHHSTIADGLALDGALKRTQTSRSRARPKKKSLFGCQTLRKSDLAESHMTKGVLVRVRSCHKNKTPTRRLEMNRFFFVRSWRSKTQLSKKKQWP